VKATLYDSNSDGTLVILTPQAFTDPTQAAIEVADLAPLADKLGKPILTSWMGGEDVQAAQKVLKKAKLPNFAFVDAGVRAFDYMWSYRRILNNLYEVTDAANLGRITGWLDAKLKSRKLIEAVRKDTVSGDEPRPILTHAQS